MKATIAELFRRLEAERLRYAVIRNYEMFPRLRDASLLRNTDIDMVIHTDDVPRWRSIASGLAADLNWDALTECAHWRHSPVREHNIDLFRFYRFSPLAFLEVDIFHAYLVDGIPLMDEAEMLAGRIYDPARHLTRIDPFKENTYRLVQIHRLSGHNRSQYKVDRYTKKVAEICESHGQEYRRFLCNRFSRFAAASLDPLLAGDQAQFVKMIGRARLSFAARFIGRHPIRAARYLSARFRENRLRYGKKQCGRVVKTFVSGPEQHSQLAVVMDNLVDMNFINEWVLRAGPSGKVTRQEHGVMEQGGLVLELSDRESAQLVVVEHDDRNSITDKLVNMLVDLHPVLFSRSADARMSTPVTES